MSVDEARRLALHDAAAHNRWNAEAAVTLMEMLPPSGWGDVATRQHLDARLEALEHRTDLRFRLVDQRLDSLEEKTDHRFDSLEERIDQRFEAFEERIDLHIERALNTSLRWMIGTMIALTGAVAAATAAVATIT